MQNKIRVLDFDSEQQHYHLSMTVLHVIFSELIGILLRLLLLLQVKHKLRDSIRKVKALITC